MLVGKTVFLQVLERADLEVIRKWRNSPDVYNFMANKDFITEVQQEQWFAKIAANRNNYYFTIRLTDQQTPIGVAHLKDIDYRNQLAEAGIYVADEKYRSNFFGLEGLYFLMNYAFSYLNLHKLYAHVLVENDSALRMNQAFGYQIEGRLRQETYYDGKFHDYHRIGVLKEEFYASEMAKRFAP